MTHLPDFQHFDWEMKEKTRVVPLFLVLCLALIGCDARGVDLGLCSDSSVACPCGGLGAGLQVQIPIKECTYFHSWIPYCKACDEYDQAALCSQFRHCLSCNARRDGKCASCPPWRYGESCQGIMTCPDPGTPQNALRQIQHPLVGRGGRDRFGQRIRGSLGPNSRVAGSVVDKEIPDGRFGVRTRITFECESRFYQLVGPQHRECQHNGEWLGRQPACIPICGISEGARSPTIISGEVSRLGKWPWHASIDHKQPDNTFSDRCDGTVVSENWIVTAAICVTNRSTSNIMPITNIQIRLGMHHRTTLGQDNGVQVFRVSEIHIHPKYDPEVLDSDIAVLRLATRATLTDRVAPVCMPGSGKSGVALAERLIAPGSVIVVTGWGDMENRAKADTLTKASMGTISNQECEDNYAQSGLPLKVTSSMFCAGHDDGRNVSCFGRSGSPAVGFSGTEENRRWFLVGVVSWGSPVDCETPLHYTGLTKMSRFLSFVNQFTGL